MVSEALALVMILASAPQAPEYQVKAHFLYNLSTTTAFTWPEGAFRDKKDPFVLGIVGSDPFGEEIEAACKDRTAQDRPIVVRRYRTPTDIKGCHLLFIPRTEKENVAKILEAVKGKPTLTVGEMEGFPASGGAVNFYLEGAKVRFEINPKAIERAGLNVRAKFLELGRIFQEGR